MISLKPAASMVRLMVWSNFWQTEYFPWAPPRIEVEGILLYP